jgi:hypothetical protein
MGGMRSDFEVRGSSRHWEDWVDVVWGERGQERGSMDLAHVGDDKVSIDGLDFDVELGELEGQSRWPSPQEGLGSTDVMGLLVRDNKKWVNSILNEEEDMSMYLYTAFRAQGTTPAMLPMLRMSPFLFFFMRGRTIWVTVKWDWMLTWIILERKGGSMSSKGMGKSGATFLRSFLSLLYWVYMYKWGTSDIVDEDADVHGLELDSEGLVDRVVRGGREVERPDEDLGGRIRVLDLLAQGLEPVPGPRNENDREALPAELEGKLPAQANGGTRDDGPGGRAPGVGP